MQDTPRPPTLPRVLGFAGLLPQVAAVAVLALGPAGWRGAALVLGHAYAALILSFLGGLWWGLAARAPATPPAWTWLAAVTPSLVAFASVVPWAQGAAGARLALAVLGVALLATLAVDRRLAADGLAPRWWLALRTPLSLGLGSLTLVAAAIA